MYFPKMRLYICIHVCVCVSKNVCIIFLILNNAFLLSVQRNSIQRVYYDEILLPVCEEDQLSIKGN